jgi:hypothetical protein
MAPPMRKTKQHGWFCGNLGLPLDTDFTDDTHDIVVQDADISPSQSIDCKTYFDTKTCGLPNARGLG